MVEVMMLLKCSTDTDDLVYTCNAMRVLMEMLFGSIGLMMFLKVRVQAFLSCEITSTNYAFCMIWTDNVAAGLMIEARREGLKR